MATYAKTRLSGGTNGRNILVVATATPGTLIHTAHATALDEVTLYVCNTDSVDRKITIELGGVTSPNDLVEFTIPTESGFVGIIPGIPLTGSVEVRAFGAAANVLVVNGYVNRIS